MSNLDYQPYYRRNLPHIQPPGATFFVTFRLTGSVPSAVLEEWQEERRRFEAEQSRIGNEQQRHDRARQFQRRRFARLEQFLDKAAHGPTWLTDQRLAKLIADSLHYRHGKVYSLDAYTIMPNHVHVVFTPLLDNAVLPAADFSPAVEPRYVALAKILHSLKGYTAHQLNKLLHRSGEFWEHESYDHYVRDEAELERIIDYVLANPYKAGLVPPGGIWPWNYSRFASSAK